ncbi:hypothetical protein RFI_16611, partial [Reticulomyxa filosa]
MKNMYVRLQKQQKVGLVSNIQKIEITISNLREQLNAICKEREKEKKRTRKRLNEKSYEKINEALIMLVEEREQHNCRLASIESELQTIQSLLQEDFCASQFKQ